MKNKDKVEKLAKKIYRLDWLHGTTWAQAVEEAKQVIANKAEYYEVD